MRFTRLAALGVAATSVAVAQVPPSPWNVTVTPTSPLRIGICGAVQLSVLNATGTDVPRNKQGHRITMADFDMSVSGPGVAGHQIDAYHYAVCACQGAAPGAQAKVKAVYPAKALAAAAVVPNVRVEREASFSIGAPVGQANPVACSQPQATPPPAARELEPAAAPQLPVAPRPATPVARAPTPTPALPAASPPPTPAPGISPETPAEITAMPDFSAAPETTAAAELAPPTFMPPPDSPDSQPVSAPVDASRDENPFAMFAALMPVFSSPRCVNCHGGTNPATNTNHKGGQQDIVLNHDDEMVNNDECVLCHNAPEARPWRLAPKIASFAGKDAKQLCRQLRSGPGRFDLRAAFDRADLQEHLQTDELIGVAFIGQKGIGRGSAFWEDTTTEPPPMTRARFVALARHWLEDGLGACNNAWNGTITETTVTEQKSSFAPAPGGRKASTETHITITVVESKATADVRWEMRDFTDAPARECATYNHQTFSALNSQVPVDLTVVINNDMQPTLESAMPAMALPAGVQLPPGFKLPDLPPAGGNFFRYQAPALVAGKHRSDILSLPGCRRALVEKPYDYHVEDTMVTLPPSEAYDGYGNPGSPNDFKGEKVTTIPGGTRKITWNLTRDQE